jgi:DNA-binding response OmpR family regulator
VEPNEWSVKVVQVAFQAEETWIVAVGITSGINTGFVSAIEAQGWRWREVPDTETLLHSPLPRRSVVALRLATFTMASYTVMRQLSRVVGVPVVVFGAAGDIRIVRATLRAGAEDFIAIPVTVEEMVARLAAVIRVRFDALDALRFSDYSQDESLQTVALVGGPTVRLSLSEFRVFRALFAARNRPISRARLLALPLVHAESDRQNALDATVSRLRRKLGADRVLTIRGTGYQLVDTCRPAPDPRPEKIRLLR